MGKPKKLSITDQQKSLTKKLYISLFPNPLRGRNPIQYRLNSIAFNREKFFIQCSFIRELPVEQVERNLFKGTNDNINEIRYRVLFFQRISQMKKLLGDI